VSARCLDCFALVTWGGYVGPVTSTSHPPTSDAVEAAGLGRRLAAIAVDWALSILVAVLVFSQARYGSSASSLATLGVFAVEVTALTWLTGASFGQRLLGLRVVRVDGGRLGLGRVAVRTLLICLVIPAVVYDSAGRGLHDRAVGSIVLRASPA